MWVWVWMALCLLVLALRQISDLSRVYSASHPMVARIDFSPPAILNWIQGFSRLEGCAAVSDFFCKQFNPLLQFVFQASNDLWSQTWQSLLFYKYFLNLYRSATTVKVLMCKVDNNNVFAAWDTAWKALGPGTYANVMFTYSIHQNIGTDQALSNVLVQNTAGHLTQKTQY